MPDFRGEWPADDAHLPGVLDGPLPVPCGICGGELTRRLKYPNLHEIDRERLSRDRFAAMLRHAGKPVPEFGPLPEPVTHRIYEIACYRSAHGYERPMAPQKSTPQPIGELVPANRTGDWKNP